MFCINVSYHFYEQLVSLRCLPQNLWRYRLLNNIGVHSKLLANLRLVNFCHFQTLVIDQLQASVFRMLQTITILYNWCQNISVGLQKWLRFFSENCFAVFNSVLHGYCLHDTRVISNWKWQKLTSRKCTIEWLGNICGKYQKNLRS